MVGPDYVKPKVEASPAAFKEMEGWKTAQPQDQLPRGKWWELFNDPQLNALEEQISVSNQSVQLSLAQYRQARALIQEARSALFPTVIVDPAITRSKSSNTLGATPVARVAQTYYAVPIEASWTVDLWGQYRRGYESTLSFIGLQIQNLVCRTSNLEDANRLIWFQFQVNHCTRQVTQSRGKV